LSELFCAVLCTPVEHIDMHTFMSILTVDCFACCTFFCVFYLLSFCSCCTCIVCICCVRFSFSQYKAKRFARKSFCKMTYFVSFRTVLESPQSRPHWLLLIYSFQFRSAIHASASPSPTLLPSPSPTSFGLNNSYD